MRQFVLLAVTAGVVSAASATTIWTDNFDAYANQAALNAAYTPKSTTPIILDQTKGHSDGQSITAGVHTGSTHPASYKNLGGEFAGTDAQPLSVKFWMDQSSVADWWARDYVELRAFEGAGWGQGATQDILALGMTSSGVPSTAAYSGRVWSGAGWFNLTLNRTAGWHLMELLVKTTKVEMYVDGELGAAQLRTPGVTFDSIVFGSGLSSQVQVWFDDVEIATVPEPAALALLAGSIVFLRRR